MAEELTLEQKRALALAAARARAEQAQAPQEAAPVTAGGLAKSFGSGALDAVERGLQAPWELGQAAARVGLGTGNWIRENVLGLPTSPDQRQALDQTLAQPIPAALQPVTEARSAMGLTHEPQNVPEAYARTAGQFLPGAVGGPGGIARRLLMGVALPAAGSETAGQLTKGTPYEPWARIGGAVAPSLAATIASRLVTPLPTAPDRAAMAATLDAEGIPMTAGQRTGSRSLRFAESALNPGKAQAIQESQGEAFTKAAMNRIGSTADRANPAALDAAGERIGQTFNDLAAQTRVPFDQRLGNQMSQILTDYETTAATASKAPRQIINRIAQAATENGGNLQGEAYKNITTELRTAAKYADPATKQALGEIRNVLDDAMERGAGPHIAEGWRGARRAYRDLLAIEKAAGGAGENTAMGLLSPSQLRTAVKGQGNRAYVRGQRDLGELARAGEALIKPMPTSGSSERLRAMAGGAGLFGLVNAIAAGSPKAAAVAALPIVGPWAAGKVLMSKPVQAYLANRLLSGSIGLPENARAAALAAILQEKRPQIPQAR